MKNLKSIKLAGTAVVFLALALAGIGMAYGQKEAIFGAFSPAAGGTYRLQASIGTTDTTIRLSSFKEPVSNNPITMSSLASDIGYGTLDPQSPTRKEFISFTGITQNADGTATLTGVTRGLSFFSPYTASSTLRKAHPGQSIFILSDSPQFFNEYALRRSNETITGNWTFSGNPVFSGNPTLSPDCAVGSSNTELCAKGYIDSVVAAGAPNANETTKGIVELSTASELGAGTSIGDTGARLSIPNSLATSTPTASCSAFCVVVAAAGKIAQSFLDLSQAYTWSGLHRFSSGFLSTASSTATNITMITATSTDFYTTRINNLAGPRATSTTFTTSGTWVRPPGISRVKVTVVGGGGAGGGCLISESNCRGGGGGGGAWCQAIVPVSGNVTVTVGAGGTGQSGGNGNAGGNSSFAGDITVTAAGGSGGDRGVTNTTVFGGNGGGCTNGNLASVSGQRGKVGNGGSGAAYLGIGGNTPWGFGGSVVPSSGNDGNNAEEGYGGGGSGAYTTSSGSAKKGGNGANGVVVVEVYEY